MIVLKQLARQVDMTPQRVRKILRKAIKTKKDHRWRWSSTTDKSYVKALTILMEAKHHGNS